MILLTDLGKLETPPTLVPAQSGSRLSRGFPRGNRSPILVSEPGFKLVNNMDACIGRRGQPIANMEVMEEVREL